MPRKILVVSDGLPGHYKKTNAVAQMVQKRFAADVQWLNVKLRFGGYRTLMRFMLNHTHRVPDAQWLNLFYDIPDGIPAAPDMIISSGGKTSFMSAWLGGALRLPVRVHRPGPRHREAVFHADRRVKLRLPGGRQAHPQRAGDRDRSRRRRGGRRAVPANRPACQPARRWTLVIGGDGGGYEYTEADWRQLRDTACRLAAQHGIRWLITTSRRTPPVAEDLFLSPEMRACADDVLIYNRDPRVVYNAFLGLAEVVVCLEDSGKMLTESVASGKPVLSVRPPIANTNERSWALIHRFETAGYIKRHDARRTRPRIR